MNIWITVTEARSIIQRERRTLILFTVTVIRRECDERHKEFRRCSPANEVTM